MGKEVRNKWTKVRAMQRGRFAGVWTGRTAERTNLFLKNLDALS
jgi:hypothetical protein